MTIKTHKFQTNVIINSSRGLSKHTFSVFDTIKFIEFFRHCLFRHRATKIACYTTIFLFYGVSVLFRTSLTILIVIKKLGYDKDINKDHKLNDTIINIK